MVILIKTQVDRMFWGLFFHWRSFYTDATPKSRASRISSSVPGFVRPAISPFPLVIQAWLQPWPSPFFHWRKTDAIDVSIERKRTRIAIRIDVRTYRFDNFRWREEWRVGHSGGSWETGVTLYITFLVYWKKRNLSSIPANTLLWDVVILVNRFRLDNSSNK